MIRSVLGAVEIAKDFTELRDLETGAHLERMARYSRLIAHAIAPGMGLPDEFVENVFLYAPLHDIGKIGIPDKVLLKPGPLDADEWAIMKTHTTKGREMVDSITADLAITTEAADLIMTNIVELHHEALDGSGYSSVSHLLDLPIAGIKLDTSITWGLSDPDSRAPSIARGLAGLAHGMGLVTVAEGVETEDQAAMLSQQGWQEAQGYLFGKPAPVERLAV